MTARDAWIGFLDSDRRWRCTVSLPANFPACLPVVVVDQQTLERRVPHVERSGKVCIATSTGLLLDDERPKALVRDALARALGTITKGVSGENDADFTTEIVAYWGEAATHRVLMSAGTEASVRTLFVGDLVNRGGTTMHKTLVTDAQLTLESLTQSLGMAISRRTTGIYVPLERSLEPPSIGKPARVGDLYRAIRTRLNPQHAQALDKQLSKRDCPFLIVLALPTLRATEPALVALQFPSSPHLGDHVGGRPRALRRHEVIQQTAMSSAVLANVDRIDPDYLLKRGAAPSALVRRRVALVGCGAVGCHIARHLCAVGVARLLLVDPDLFSHENLHRHILALRDIGKPKVDGLRRFLFERFPHTDVETYPTKIEDTLVSNTKFLDNVDAIVFATGDETLERSLARTAGARVQLHAWVEPLGIGGHVFVAGALDRPGCIRCLYGRDHDGMLYNRASFAEAGQEFTRTMAGCSDSYSPFTSLDAERAAAEALRVLEERFRTADPRARLVSWLESKAAFLAQGHRLSSLGHDMGEGERRASYPDIVCTMCSR